MNEFKVEPRLGMMRDETDKRAIQLIIGEGSRGLEFTDPDDYTKVCYWNTLSKEDRQRVLKCKCIREAVEKYERSMEIFGYELILFIILIPILLWCI